MTESINLAELDIHKHFIKVRNGLRIIHIGNGGGTGGILTSNILKMIGTLNEEEKFNISYVGIDGDIFEPKNLGRQLCLPCDMGKNKAQVLVSRYAKAYGLKDSNAKYIDSFINSADEVSELLSGINSTTIIIDTVDKNKPRLDISNAINKRIDNAHAGSGAIYSISCGNGEWAGQTTLGAKLWERGSNVGIKPNISIMDPAYEFSIPLAFERFPELIDLAEDAADEALSCADRAITNAQSLIANNMGATFALNYVTAIIHQYKHYMDRSKPTNISVADQSIGTCRFNALMNSVENYRLTTDYLLNRGDK